MGERRLIERLRSGDAEACAQLVRDHYAAIYRMLARLTRDKHAAEDLCQETFAAAWRKIGSFAGASSLRTWLHRIAYRRLLDWRRDTNRRRVEPSDRESQQPTGPFAAVVADEQSREVLLALDRLDEPWREVLVLHYLEGLSYRQIAQLTGEPAGTIKWRTSAALRKLRQFLPENDELDPGQTSRAPAAQTAAAADPAGA